MALIESQLKQPQVSLTQMPSVGDSTLRLMGDDPGDLKFAIRWCKKFKCLRGPSSPAAPLHGRDAG